MRLFRLENRKDEGVYSRGFAYTLPHANHHVGPEQDPLLKDWWEGKGKSKKGKYEWEFRDRKEWFFAFESIAQVVDWFPREALIALKALADKHQDTMALSVYDVSPRKIKRGESQMLFHMPSAEFVERISLQELIDMVK